MKRQNKHFKGVLLVILSTILWAINGNVGSYLFKYKEITPEHLTMFRLIIPGLFVVIHQYVVNGKKIFYVFHRKTEVFRLMYFAFFGLLAMQYSYFVAIRYSNPATATLLQSLAPFIIVLITSLMDKRLPSKGLLFSLFIAIIGSFLLITHGKIDQLAITGLALLFGISAAIGSVNYNLGLSVLQEKYSTLLLMGWSMLISGIGFTILLKPWENEFLVDSYSILGIIYVMAFGTLCPFLFYLISSKIIGPKKASILSLMEPLFSTFIAVIFMGVKFLAIDYLGIVMILFSLMLLTIKKESNTNE